MSSPTSASIKSTLAITLILWLLSPSFYWLWADATPIGSSFLPPLSIGQRILLAPHLVMEQMGYWLWPFGREPLILSFRPEAVMRLGLFYWLVVVLVLRLAWRLKKIDPAITWGIVCALISLIPFSGLIPHWVMAFDTFPILFAGLGLSFGFGAVIARALAIWRQPTDPRDPRGRVRRQLWCFASLVIGIWSLALAGNLVVQATQTWPERLAKLQSANANDVVVAVESARQLALNGKDDDAESLIVRCGQAMPWYPEIPIVKANILLMRGHSEDAIIQLNRALELHPDHAKAIQLLESDSN
ncbi:MAG: tetratricopeptide repeat protein [Verrucomicrobiota bacterium]